MTTKDRDVAEKDKKAEEKSQENNDDDEHSSGSYTDTSSTSLDEDDSQYSYISDSDDEDDEEEEMPLLKYARIVGSLPRCHPTKNVDNDNDDDTPPKAAASPPLKVPCTCMTMGCVTLSTSDIAAAAAKASNLLSEKQQQQQQQLKPNLLYIIPEEKNSKDEKKGQGGGGDKEAEGGDNNVSSQRRYDVLALGFADGTIRIIDPRTGGSILEKSTEDGGGGGGGGGSGQVLRVASLSSSSAHTAAAPAPAPMVPKPTSLFGGFGTSSAPPPPTTTPTKPTSPPPSKKKEASSAPPKTTTTTKNQYNPKEAIVSAKFDSTGTYLAAINKNGDAAIFEFKYTPTSFVVTDDSASSRFKGALVEASNVASSAMARADAEEGGEMLGKKDGGGSGGGGGGGLKNFWGAFATAAVAASKESSTPTKSSSSMSNSNNSNTPPPANLSIVHPIPTSKFHYSRNTHSIPTCLALDPSYGRRREKVTLIGFADGRLIMTKRGGMVFSRRNDSVLYQGTASSGRGKRGGGAESSSSGEVYKGVECVVWRGALVAWADASGIKIYDIEQLQRIAHVDRPTGARSTLYPTISSLSPTLLFEKSDSLIFAWGDCIMGMKIKETTPSIRSAAGAGDKNGGSGTGGDTQAPVIKKRTVELSMAWELDCVSAGVVPLDADHVAVLGLVPVHSSEEEEESKEETSEKDPAMASMKMTGRAKGDNILELQILSRSTGMITSSDALPLLVPPSSPSKTADSSASRALGRSKILTDAASEYGFVSSFAVPRMDDAIEAEAESEFNEDEDDDDEFELSMFNVITGGPSTGGEGGAGAPAVAGSGSSGSKRVFVDPHIKWNIRSITCTDDDEEDNANDDASKDGSTSAKSTNSDDYTFLFRPQKTSKTSTATAAVPTPSVPPIMVIGSPADAVLVRTRDVDDAISFARARGRHGLALRRALKNRRKLRRHCLNELINEYLMAVLCLNRRPDIPQEIYQKMGDGGGGKLTVSRLQTAAKATPILLGSSISMWERWIYEFAKIPGGLFVLREYLPVRDPKLSSSLYEMVLEKMFIEVESMLSKATLDNKQRNVYLHGYAKSAQDAADLYLNTLRAWGTTSSIRERIKLRKLFHKQRLPRSSWTKKVFDPALKQAEMDLYVRMNQTAAGYLQTSAPHLPNEKLPDSASDTHALKSSIDLPTGTTSDALFDMIAVSARLSSRLPSPRDNSQNSLQDGSPNKGSEKKSNAIVMIIEAIADLEFMQGNYDEALRLFLTIGAQFTDVPLSDLEDEAVRSVEGNGWQQDNTKDNPEDDEERKQDANEIRSLQRYHHVLAMIESHHLHRSLLDKDEIQLIQTEESDPSSGNSGEAIKGNCSPVIAFIRLVGLDLSGKFLVENCVPPPVSVSMPPEMKDIVSQEAHPKDQILTAAYGDRSANLPLNMVAAQLRSSPKLLHWYLHQVFVHKPEVYVKFPNTAVPPKEITDLHRIHLEFYIEYANEKLYDKERNLSVVPAYDVAEVETPLMAFLKAALPYGGARPDDVRRMLEERRGTKTESPLFALELAFVIQKSGSDTVEDSKKILELYIEGAKSLPMAVGYAERNTKYSTVLWEMLVARCLQSKPNSNDKIKGRDESSGCDGSLFGALLEAAARCGADLAHLVSQIPEGMRIEGLRPRLVAAVADYRLKLKIHESASDVLSQDKVILLRELIHRSRRGLRVLPQTGGNRNAAPTLVPSSVSNPGKTKNVIPSTRAHKKANSIGRRRSRGQRHTSSLPIR